MKAAFLTAGGIAPCLSASIGRLIWNYSGKDIDVEMIGYLHGYKGLLTGQSISLSQDVLDNSEVHDEFGGSPFGNRQVKHTNADDCMQNGYIEEGADPLKIAADQLSKENITL